MSAFEPELRERVARLSLSQRALLAERLADRGAGPGATGATSVEARGAGSGGRLVAYVAGCSDGESRPDPAALRALVAGRLPEYMVPSAVIVLDRLPRTPNGKVDVRALPAPAASPPALLGGFVAARNPAEDALLGIWREVLGVSRIGVHDNFFEIGGDSILSIQVVARATQAGFRLTPGQLFDYPTIAGLAAVAGTAKAVEEDPEEAGGQVPLTPIQHWFFDRPLANPSHWHHLLWLDAAELDPGILGSAVRSLVPQHDALRLRFTREAGLWTQRIEADPEPIRIEVLDLSTMPEAELEGALTAAADALAARTDLAEGGAALLVVHLGSGRGTRIAIAIHHLLVDPISWQILTDDLNAAYTALSRGEPVVLPERTRSFRSWARAIQEFARADASRREAAYWLDLPREALAVPEDFAGEFTEASTRTIESGLSGEETAALLQTVPSAYRVQPEEALLAALAEAMRAWAGISPLLVGVERHGRETIVEGLDLSRTVGWLTSYFPLLLRLDGVTRPGDVLMRIKEQVRAVPGRGVGFGAALYLSPDDTIRERLRAIPEPRVIFNYAGRLTEARGGAAAPFRVVGLPTASRDPRNRRTHVLEINAMIRDERLQVYWSYSANIHRDSTIDRLVREYSAALKGLIEHCASPAAGGFTPSDFPEAGLSQDALDDFLGRISS